MLVGKWDEAMYYVLGDPTTKPKGYDPMTEAVLLWERGKTVTKTRYNLTPFAISLNELTPGLLDKLPPTDSRLRPDQRYLENGEYELANAEKLRLEQLQRQVFTQRSSVVFLVGYTRSYEFRVKITNSFDLAWDQVYNLGPIWYCRWAAVGFKLKH